MTERAERVCSLICGSKRWPFFSPEAQTLVIHVQDSQSMGAFISTGSALLLFVNLVGPWRLVWMPWKITTSRGRLVEVACAGLVHCTKAASYGCLRSPISWLVFTIEWKLGSFSLNRIINEMWDVLNSRWWQGSEQQRWDAAVLILWCLIFQPENQGLLLIMCTLNLLILLELL